MVDVQKHIIYWRTGAEDALDTAELLIREGKAQHGLFFAHLALEKALKAHVVKETQDLAPYIHDMVKLAEVGGLSLDKERIKLLLL